MERSDIDYWPLLIAGLMLTGLAAGAAISQNLTDVTSNEDGTVLNEPGGPAVNMTGDTTVSNASGDVNETAIQWVTTDGNFTAVSNGDTEVTVDVSDYDARWTTLTRINATKADLTVSTSGPKPAVTVSGNVTELSYQTSSEIDIDDGSPDWTFSADGPGAVTLRNLPASRTFVAATESQVLGNYTTGPDGSATISVDSEQDAKVYMYSESPATLEIYNESSPSQPINNTSAPITVYPGSGDKAQIIEQSTDTGTLKLGGIPGDKPLVITADAPGYRPRRIFVPSLFETQRIYLLPDSADRADVIFEIQDFSGQYSSSTTVMEIQRSIDGEWRTVLGDYFGATGEFSAQLAYNTRHRLILRNIETGETRNLGTYTPLSSEIETISVAPNGSVDKPDRPPNLNLKPSGRQLVAGDTVPLEAELTKRTQDLNSWNISVYLINTTAGTNQTLATQSGTDPDSGTLQTNIDLSGNSGSIVKIVASWSTDRSDGSSVARYSVSRVFDEGGLLSGLDGLVDLVPDQNQSSFTTMLAIVVIIIGTTGMAKVSSSSEMIGAFALVLVATFGVLGWLGYEILFVGIVCWVIFAFLRRGY